MSFNTTALTTSLGAYFRKQDPILVKRLVNGMDSAKMFRVVNCKDEVPLISVKGANLLRPQLHDNAWNPVTGSVEFAPRILKVRPGKMDLALVPASLWNTYLGVQAKAGSADQNQMPFEQFIYEYLLEKIIEEVELNTTFKGIYNAGGTTATDIASGFQKIIVDEITATNLTPVTTAALTAANAYDAVWAVYKALPTHMLNKPTVAIVSYATYFFYLEDYAAQFTAAPYNTSFDKVMLHGTQCKIVPFAGMGTSSRIIITDAENMVLGFDMESDFEKLKVEPNRRGLDIMCDFRIGTQIADLRNMAVNNLA